MGNITEKHILPTKVLLKLKTEENKVTPSGILIPNTASKVTSCGTVIIVGEGVASLCKDKPLVAGMEIMFSPHAGIKVRYEDEDFTLVGISDVLLYW